MEELRFLIATTSEYEHGVVMSILEENKIPFEIREEGYGGMGGYMRIYSGSSVWGTKIYVRESDLERARDVIANFLPDEEAQTDGEKDG